MQSKPDNYYDLVVADPPLGKRQDGRQKRAHWLDDKGKLYFIKDGGYTAKSWDETLPAMQYFKELFRIDYLGNTLPTL